MQKKQANSCRNDLKAYIAREVKNLNDKGWSSQTQREYLIAVLSAALFSVFLDIDIHTVFEDTLGFLNDKREKYVDEECLGRAKSFVNANLECEDIEYILSWGYQYANKYIENSHNANTQFFTEKYMVDYIIRQCDSIEQSSRVLDLCCGGGNFLMGCCEYWYNSNVNENKFLYICEKVRGLLGYDIDPMIAKVALLSVRIKVIGMLFKDGIRVEYSLINNICPNIFVSVQERIGGALDISEDHYVLNVLTSETMPITKALGNADVIITNPPFASRKGMAIDLKDFLVTRYKNANCDTCASFVYAVNELLGKDGECGMVTQNAWMFLSSFKEYRKAILDRYRINYILNLGSRAFKDLSGEKANVSLIGLSKKKDAVSTKYVDLSSDAYAVKKDKVERNEFQYTEFDQHLLEREIGGFACFGECQEVRECKVLDVAIPMQGTSTGNAKEYVGYFWEHFSDSEWKLVSKGGGYCRWEGLNCYKVKWGTDGELVRLNKGAALRNTQYFTTTQLVFSDTGTSGLNVRVLLPNQIFIASGPGIRVNSCDEYALMAYLNSRLASFYIRGMSPKLTIAAGYIGKLAYSNLVDSSKKIKTAARRCVSIKETFFKARPNYYEYDRAILDSVCGELRDFAKELFLKDMRMELEKLELEEMIDRELLSIFDVNLKIQKEMEDIIGICAYSLKETYRIVDADVDRLIASIMDASCILKKSNKRDHKMGLDGVLEFISKKLNINPDKLFHQIEMDIDKFEKTISKYEDLILHNLIINCMEYDVDEGFGIKSQSIIQIVDMIEGQVSLNLDLKEWISSRFQNVHAEIFKNISILKVNDNLEIEVI